MMFVDTWSEYWTPAQPQKAEKIKKIYLDRFNDALDFDFFITGDVKKEDLKPLLVKYIASIPTKNTKEIYIHKRILWFMI